MIETIIWYNGIYDILCALCILKFIQIPILQDLHLSMIQPDVRMTKVHIHRFASWIYINGMIRLTVYIPLLPIRTLVSYSYYVEALVFSFALMLRYVKTDKTLFVIATSLLLGHFSGKMENRLH